jgi:hypothetical protein
VTQCHGDLRQTILKLVAATSRRSCPPANGGLSAQQDHAWIQDISGALTVQVLIQYIETRQRLQAVQLLPGVADKFVWRWDVSGSYSCRSAYRALFLGQAQVLGAAQLWKVRAPNRCRFHAWLVGHRKGSTITASASPMFAPCAPCKTRL